MSSTTSGPATAGSRSRLRNDTARSASASSSTPSSIVKRSINAKQAGVSDRVRFLTQDLFETDISQATVVTLFLLPRINQDLIPKLRRELKPGTRIVSHQFDMGEQWPPEKSQDVNGLMIYLWTIH